MLSLLASNPEGVIVRLAQGTPVAGCHDENGHLVIPKEYDDDYLKD